MSLVDFVGQVVSAISLSAFYALITCFFLAVPEIRTRDPPALSPSTFRIKRESLKGRADTITVPMLVCSTSPCLCPDLVLILQVAHRRSNGQWKTIIIDKVLDASKVKHFILG